MSLLPLCVWILVFVPPAAPGAATEPTLATAQPGPVPAEAPGATTYYIDSVAGQNVNAGISPEAAWRDFSNINGRTLGAGDRLLIKRGSVIHQELRVSAKGTAPSAGPKSAPTARAPGR